MTLQREVQVFPPGLHAPEPQPGDIFLTSGSRLISRAIQASQRLRLSPEYAFWNHAGAVVDDAGYILESLEWGPEVEHISKYLDSTYALIRPAYHPHDREQVLEFLTGVRDSEWSYGYLQIASVLFSLLTGSKLAFSHTGSYICSALVADALTRAGCTWRKPSAFVTPGDIAVELGVAWE